ncbi:aminotransferase class V-fold PLP-dependent enzyme [Rapidithrix thailandica]|uniref:Aminotransferase class V-fold PLP-dependent enzyme n=1 Tax=Rapidithrix thailandica TaxID=413964 RepID=A0AAW9S5M2_9BACT
MSKNIYLTPGPSELYFTVQDHLKTAIQEDVCSISHRSQAFMDIYQNTAARVKELLGVPEEYYLVFTNTATEVWERLIQNCAEKQTYHLVNGSFSKRFYEFSGLLGRKATKLDVPFGEGFDIDQVVVPEEAEMICVTQNETSSGAALPVDAIYQLREKYPDQLIAVDAVSSVPYLNIDYRKIDSLFFSVQKGMGLPAGLGVWIFNQRCVEKANSLEAKGLSIGTYHSIPSLLEKAVKHQTPATPNVLGIYLLGKVCEDMLRRGVEQIRQEVEHKAALTYNFFEAHPNFECFVQKKEHQSQTVLVANLVNCTFQQVSEYLKPHLLQVGSGYGKWKTSQIRIANFPTHSKETFFKLLDLLQEFKA